MLSIFFFNLLLIATGFFMNWQEPNALKEASNIRRVVFTLMA
jgi:hypothetical protein